MKIELKLKPCPFCGGEAKKNMARAGTGELKHYISCQKCYARSRSFAERRSIFGYRLTDWEVLCETGKGNCEECWNEVMKNERNQN